MRERIFSNVEWRLGCSIFNAGRNRVVRAKQLELCQLLRSDSETRNHRARDEMRDQKSSMQHELGDGDRRSG